MGGRLVYVDTSALLKLLFAEAESDNVRAFISAAAGEGIRLVSSEWVAVELLCAANARAHLDSSLRGDARAVLRLVDQIRLDRPTLLASTELPYRLRAGDAVHMATVVCAGIERVLVFDRQFETAVRDSGRTVLHGSTDE